MKASYTFRSIAELAQVAEADLPSCLAALHRSLVEARRQHAAALRGQLIAPNAPFEFPAFTWKPTGARSDPFPALAATLGPETPINELPVRPRVRFVLHQRNVFCLEDLAAISENELLRGDGVGVKTVGRLREMLQAVGLNFLPNPDERGREFDETRALRALPEEARDATLLGLADDAPVSQLALRPVTLRRAQRAGFRTVGELRATNPVGLAGRFGPAERREIYGRLLQTGQAFREGHPVAELWRYGLIERDKMQFPEDPGTPLSELRPWLEGAFKPLKKRGVADLGTLRALAEQGELAEVSGIGEFTATRLAVMLGMAAPSTASSGRQTAQNELWKVLSHDPKAGRR
ncbi:hypothetical protein LJR175_008201 [Variovorax sp. LjRoot175]|uniref:hypothetical protein n=1 Tax=Variovorax sp. LjRoot175 TaxID=3342276 RepID=UPI003ED15B16